VGHSVTPTLRQATQIGRRVHIGEATQKGDAPSTKVRKRVGERVWRGPADIGERAGWAAWAETHEPISAISCGTEHSVGTAQGTECVPNVGGACFGYVAADNHCPPTFHPAKRAVHAGSEIATALVDTLRCHRQRKARAVWGNGKNGAAASFGGEPLEQDDHGVSVEIECGACTDPSRKPPFHGTEPWCAAKYDYCIAHDLAQYAAQNQ
jgi:hypothetical protein